MDLKEHLDNSKSKSESVQKDSELINSKENKRIVAITTIDNPYDPIDNFDEWYAYDCQQGYNTCCYLARVVSDSNDMIDEEMYEDLERAIDKIIYYDPTGMYLKIVRGYK